MTDEEIVLYFNEHRLAKLESYLLKDGSSVEHELQNLLDRFYEQIVPEHERMEVEAQIELERENVKRHSEKLPAASPSFISMKEMTTFSLPRNFATASTASQTCTAPR